MRAIEIGVLKGVDKSILSKKLSDLCKISEELNDILNNKLVSMKITELGYLNKTMDAVSELSQVLMALKSIITQIQSDINSSVLLFKMMSSTIEELRNIQKITSDKTSFLPKISNSMEISVNLMSQSVKILNDSYSTLVSQLSNLEELNRMSQDTLNKIDDTIEKIENVKKVLSNIRDINSVSKEKLAEANNLLTSIIDNVNKLNTNMQDLISKHIAISSEIQGTLSKVHNVVSEIRGILNNIKDISSDSNKKLLESNNLLSTMIKNVSNLHTDVSNLINKEISLSTTTLTTLKKVHDIANTIKNIIDNLKSISSDTNATTHDLLNESKHHSDLLTTSISKLNDIESKVDDVIKDLENYIKNWEQLFDDHLNKMDTTIKVLNNMYTLSDKISDLLNSIETVVGEIKSYMYLMTTLSPEAYRINPGSHVDIHLNTQTKINYFLTISTNGDINIEVLYSQDGIIYDTIPMIKDSIPANQTKSVLVPMFTKHAIVRIKAPKGADITVYKTMS